MKRERKKTKAAKSNKKKKKLGITYSMMQK